MNVRTKILLLLLLIVVAFSWGLIAIERRDGREFQAILEKRLEEKSKAFDQLSTHWGESLETFASYVSCWDGMVSAISQNDDAWGITNLSDSFLASYRSQAVWVYKADGTLFLSKNGMYSDEIPAAPIPSEKIKELIRDKQVSHFYAWTPAGFMEVRGASVHPSLDVDRKTPASGYFFAGRVCTDRDLEELSLFTGNKISLVRPSELLEIPRNDPALGTVCFSRSLPGWDGVPVAKLQISNDSPEYAQMRRSNSRGLKWLMVFALGVLIVVAVSLLRWVTVPLRILSESMRRQDATGLEALDRDNGEFGVFARLISRFFIQQKELVRETEERRITQEALKQSEEQLRHSQKMDAVGQLAGGIAHDFNNLLTAIIGYSEILIAKLSEQPENQQKADVILKAGRQAAALTRQLLAFSRKQLLQPRIVDLNDLIHNLEHLLRRLLGETIELRVEADAHPAIVLADPTQVEQVIINLCVNARDAMPKGGVLTVRTTEHAADSEGGRTVALCVSDEGVGMDARTLGKIFEPFFTTKEIGKGTGLGLATVYGIVQQSGGKITVESEPGHGTTFHVILPEGKGEVEKETTKTVSSTQISSETLLVVEDEEIVRDFVCTALSEQGYNVLCAENGAVGLKMAKEYSGKISLLLSDVIMPGMNGSELARQLAEVRPDIPVLFVSGYSDNDLARHGTVPMEVNFLEKPFSPATLCAKVREVLDLQLTQKNH